MVNKIIKKCLVCKKEYKVWPHEFKKRKFCSHQCSWINLTGQSHLTIIKDKKLYHIWSGIKRRCNNPNDMAYLRYGGRGIKCLWKSYNEFQNDMYNSFKKHLIKYGRNNTQIDRIDNNGNYYKNNCCWATCKEQARNRSNRVEISYNGKTMSITEWAEYLNIPKIALWLRIKRYKWPIEKALTKPIRKIN